MMYTAKSNEGVTFPYSGRLIGLILDGCALRQRFNEATKDGELSFHAKTVQRYSKGEFVKNDEVVESILRFLSKSLCSEKHSQLNADIIVPELCFETLRHLTKQWDWFVSIANSQGFKLNNNQEVLLVLARFGVLDLGMRFAALLRLSGVSFEAFERQCTTDVFDRLIDDCRGDLTWESFIENKPLTLQTLHNWRTGASLPQAYPLQDLVDCCIERSESPTSFEETLFTFRFARLGVFIWTQLEKALNDNLRDKLKQTFLTTVRLTERYLSQNDSVPEGNAVDLQLTTLLTYGFGCAHGRWVCDNILPPPTDEFEDITNDLYAMSHPETMHTRVEYWARKIGSWGVEMRDAARDSDQFIASLRPHIEFEEAEHVMRMLIDDPLLLLNLHYSLGEYDRVSDGGCRTVFRPPAAIRGYNEYNNLASQGRDEEAAQLMRERIQEDPTQHYAHFLLAAALGKILGHSKWMLFDLYTEAMSAIYKAIELAPSEGVYHNELAIILSNAKMHERAEQAYVLAEPLYGHHTTHWHGRGMNYMYLEETQKAEHAFEKALKCIVGGEHVPSMICLAAIYMKHGKFRQAGKIRQALVKRGVQNPNPVEDWEKILLEVHQHATR